MATNAQFGKIVLIIAVSIFIYYFFWVSILPFMLIDEVLYNFVRWNAENYQYCQKSTVLHNSEHISLCNLIHSFFPPLEYAFILPAVFGVIFLGGIAIYTLYHLWSFAKTKSD